jgi:hypothetical protein
VRRTFCDCPIVIKFQNCHPACAIRTCQFLPVVFSKCASGLRDPALVSNWRSL